MYDKAAKLFEIPEPALPFANSFLNDEERRFLGAADGRDYSIEELHSLLKKLKITGDPDAFIREAYSRGVLDKAENGGTIFYRPANF